MTGCSMKRVALLVPVVVTALSLAAWARAPAGSGEIARLERLWNEAHLRADCAEWRVVSFHASNNAP